MKYSLIIPCLNEEESVKILSKNIIKIFKTKKTNDYELIFIDDGSTDKTFKILSEISKRSAKIKVIKLKQNQGQTFAISTGVKYAKGEIIILMDSDLQNDPDDIPKLINKIEKEGYDVVSGWRHKRKDKFLTRVLPSKAANFIISFISGVKLKDYGCTLKAYKKEYIKNIKLYGEMHRFIPIYAKMQGARITETKVKHHPRRYGKSKYGLFRIFKVILDLLVVKFIKSYYSKPIYFFGGTGFLVIGMGFILSIIVLVQKFSYNIWVHKNPLVILAVMLFIIGFQFILFGVLAEIEVRTFFEVRKDPHLIIEKMINIR